MAARPTKKVQNALVVTKAVKAASTVTIGMPVSIDTATDTVLDATSGQNAFGIAAGPGNFGDTLSAGAMVQVYMLTGGAIVPVKVGTTNATQGGYAEVGTTGAVDRTLGGGTTVRYILGKFAETGVSGDFVGLIVGQFAGVSS